VARLQDEVAIGLVPEELPRKLRFTGLAAALLFGLAVLGIALLEFQSRRLDSIEQVAEGLGIKVVGTVPACPRRLGLGARGAKLAEENWRAVLADAVDATRTMLLHAAEAGPAQVVMVTSALDGEGKTSFASHLAVSLARAGRTTLLLDSDLRNPSGHELFGLNLGPGFAEWLRDECDLTEALRPTPVNGLTMLTAGQCDSRTLALLLQGRVASLFEQLRARFDFIVLDSSPILPVPDTLQLALHVDGVLLCLLHEVSRLPKVYEAARRVEALGIPVLGTVVNGTRDDTYRSYGHRYPVAPSS
jgi:capsular exopolysaccharide synthesis family protein